MKTRLCAQALGMMLCLCAAGVAFAAAKGGGKAPSAKPAAASLVWRGDQTSARAYMDDLAHGYEVAQHGHVHVVLQPFSTISGLDAVNSGSADLAGSARPPMPDRPEEKNTNFHPLAWDALVLITSPQNPVANVTLKQLHDIYLGRLTNWSALGGQGATINLYAVAGPLDGNEYSFRDLIFHHGDQAVSVPRLYVNTEKLEEGIAIDPHGLGLTTYSAARANPALKMLDVEGVSASTASIADGSYPLYSTLFLAEREDDAHHDAVVAFLKYAQSDAGAAVLRRHGLVPYGEAPNLAANVARRSAFIDAHVYAPVAVAVASSEGETPVSAPLATADALLRDAPATERAQEAKYRAERLRAERAAAAAAAKPDGAIP